MSIMLANFGKYAISDCPFIYLFLPQCSEKQLGHFTVAHEVVHNINQYGDGHNGWNKPLSKTQNQAPLHDSY